MNIEGCKGCRTYEKCKSYEGNLCQVIEYGDPINCPCRNCIVKSVCDDTCKKFLEWQIEVINS